MINLTDELEFRIDGYELAWVARKALDAARDVLVGMSDTTGFTKAAKNSFSCELSEEEQLQPLSQTFLQAAFQWCQRDSRNAGAEEFAKILREYFPLDRLAAHFFAAYRRGLRVMLVELWCQGALMLPTTFRTGTFFPQKEFSNELMEWVAHLAISDDVVNGDKNSVGFRLKNFGHRLIWATDWDSIEDISLVDLAHLLQAQAEHVKGEWAYSLSGTNFPCVPLAELAIANHPNRVSFSADDHKRFCKWVVMRAGVRNDFATFSIPLPRKRRTPGSTGAATSVGEASRRGATELGDFKPNPFARLKGHRISTIDSAVMELVGAEESIEHHALICDYVRTELRPVGYSWRLAENLKFEGRAHVDAGTILRLWGKCFEGFLRSRKRSKHTTDVEAKSTLNTLTVYLCFYLPWWIEQFPAPQVPISVPLSPKDFNRFGFVCREEDYPVDRLPMTLFEFVALRRSTPGSYYAQIRMLYEFFEYVETAYMDNEEIAGRQFRSPLFRQDLPPSGDDSGSKSNKPVIPERLYGYLLFYGYAVEAFGEFLLEAVLDGRQQAVDLKDQLRFDCEAIGFVPTFHYRGELIKLTLVPNVFVWTERELVKTGERYSLPHLSALRLCQCALETGLRAQSIQWLDRKSFDKFNIGASELDKTYILYVNTDKSHGAWVTVVINRVRQTLYREIAFQRMFPQFELQQQVMYEGRDVFEPLLAIFRRPNSDEPLDDEDYFYCWFNLLIEFENFYKEVTGEKCVPLYNFGTSRLDESGGQGNRRVMGIDKEATLLYCPVRPYAIYNVHSCRVTFATNRQAKGLLVIGEAQALLGHSGTKTTGRYTKPTTDHLRSLVEFVDDNVMGDFLCFEARDSQDSVYIRADAPDSALRTALESNREQAIKAFRFISIGSWSMDEETSKNLNGVSLLRDGPMGAVVYRETHVCPVGEDCPKEVLDALGGARKRCGACPIAAKCVDHLPAIGAKVNSLKVEIVYLDRKIEALRAAKEPQATINETWQLKEWVTTECAGWELSERVLRQELERAQAEGRTASPDFLVIQPDAVRKHLIYVSRDLSSAQFLLQHLGEANVYRGMVTPQLLSAAKLAAKRLSAGVGLAPFKDTPPVIDGLDGVARMLNLMLKASGKSLKDLQLQLDGSPMPALELFE